MSFRDATPSDWTGWSDGSHDAAYEVLGARQRPDGRWQVRVWAPNARSVSVVGDWNRWDQSASPMLPSDGGIWSIDVGGSAGMRYKFRITTRNGDVVDKADPFAFHSEEPPGTASVLWNLDHDWNDDAWVADRARRMALDAPISIYEVHLGSWSRAQPVRYRDVGPRLAEHVHRCGFTHVELLPVMEHPFYGSWGYQTTGYFAPTCRYGSPQDLMAMIDHLHREDIGVILDWVPSHFPEDAFALAEFDGTHLFEHADPRLGFHPDWKSLIFNYGRNEVRAFLTSSARFWLDRYHADGIRVDAVASMLYRDYSRGEGEWLPNELGGNENLEAVSFLQHLNTAVYRHHPDVQMFAEESTAWPGVSRPVDAGGLGFGLKWDMGWMHDTLEYLQRDPVHRAHHHREITFRSEWAATENFTLPLSHDEVVHGKGSLLAKMPGDDWQQQATLRLLLGWQWAQPGKKLLFMGGELARTHEWSHEGRGTMEDPGPDADATMRWVRALNDLYSSTPALHVGDCQPDGFEWIVGDDDQSSVCVFARTADGCDPIVVVANFTPQVHRGYEIGVPMAGTWHEVLTGDDLGYGGSGVTNDPVPTRPESLHGRPQRIALTVAPLAVMFLAPGSSS